jgi:hypothetical protein
VSRCAGPRGGTWGDTWASFRGEVRVLQWSKKLPAVSASGWLGHALATRSWLASEPRNPPPHALSYCISVVLQGPARNRMLVKGGSSFNALVGR